MKWSFRNITYYVYKDDIVNETKMNLKSLRRCQVLPTRLPDIHCMIGWDNRQMSTKTQNDQQCDSLWNPERAAASLLLNHAHTSCNVVSLGPDRVASIGEEKTTFNIFLTPTCFQWKHIQNMPSIVSSVTTWFTTHSDTRRCIWAVWAELRI